MDEIKYPSQTDKDPKRKSMGNWIMNQRRMYRMGKLSQKRIQQLELLPGWVWTKVHSTSNKKKQRLLKMAQQGAARPRKKTKLGGALRDYTHKYSNAYDPEFDKEIRQLAPHWFKVLYNPEEKKQQLLKMAQQKKDQTCERIKTRQKFTGVHYQIQWML